MKEPPKIAPPDIDVPIKEPEPNFYCDKCGTQVFTDKPMPCPKCNSLMLPILPKIEKKKVRLDSDKTTMQIHVGTLKKIYELRKFDETYEDVVLRAIECLKKQL